MLDITSKRMPLPLDHIFRLGRSSRLPGPAFVSKKVIFHRGGIQKGIATGLGASKTELSLCHLIIRCIWMFLSAVLQEILLSEVSSPAYTGAAWNVAWKSALIMLVTHMFRICGLRTEWLVLSLSLAREFLESLVAELGALGMRADGKDIFEPRCCSNGFVVCL